MVVGGMLFAYTLIRSILILLLLISAAFLFLVLSHNEEVMFHFPDNSSIEHLHDLAHSCKTYQSLLGSWSVI